MSFQNATRQNLLPAGSIAYSSGAVAPPLNLDKTALLGRLFMFVAGTLTLTHATVNPIVMKADAPWSLIKRIKVKANSGTILLDTTGYGLFVRNLVKYRNTQIDVDSAGRDFFQFDKVASSGGTANNFNFGMEIPISLNDRDPVGLLLLQNQETLISIEVEWDTEQAMITTSSTTASLSATAYFMREIFSVPRKEEDYPDLSFVHQILEDKQPIIATGENAYIFQRGNIYTRAIMVVTLNGAFAADADIVKLKIKYNESEVPYELRADQFRWFQYVRYGRALPLGVYVFDWSMQQIPDLGSARDFINSARVSEMKAIVEVASGATLGSNNNNVRCIREQLIPLKKTA